MKNFWYTLVAALTLLSCQSRKPQESRLDYMKNIEQVAEETAMRYSYSTIQPGDQLMIVVSGKDLDVVKPFNQNWSSSQMLQNVQAGGNLSPTVAPVSGPTYLVDNDGNIDMPIIGRLNTTGKTIEKFKDEVRAEVSRYIINPTVTMRNINFKVTVLGEVARPGEYTVADGHTTLLRALGMAGDLTIYGKRDNVLVIRNEDGQLIRQRIDLTDASFISSPFYNLKQGDVIYVSPNETREIVARQNPNLPIWLSVASVSVGILGLIVALIK